MARTFGLQWHLTNECDQRCQHCYIWQKHEQDGLRVVPTFVQCGKVIDGFLAFCEEMEAAPYFSLTGGDPLLYDGIWQVLELIRQKGVKFTILGNPFHLNDAVAAKLKEAGCRSYQMSLDGLEQTHDGLRKRGSFQATVGALPVLRRAGIRSMIMSTVSLLNYREIPDVARLCVDRQVGNFAFSRYCPTHDDPQFNMPPELYREFLAGMWQVFTEYADRGTNFALKDHLWVAYLHEEGLYKLSDHQGIVLDGCNCGIKHMTLLPNGTVYACRRFDSPVGNVSRQTFKEIFLSPEMDRFRRFDQLQGCKDCELLNYCRGCHAVAAGTTGNFFDQDPQCWRC